MSRRAWGWKTEKTGRALETEWHWKKNQSHGSFEGICRQKQKIKKSPLTLTNIGKHTHLQYVTTYIKKCAGNNKNNSQCERSLWGTLVLCSCLGKVFVIISFQTAFLNLYSQLSSLMNLSHCFTSVCLNRYNYYCTVLSSSSSSSSLPAHLHLRTTPPAQCVCMLVKWTSALIHSIFHCLLYCCVIIRNYMCSLFALS